MVEPKMSLVEFLCLGCGFQGLEEKGWREIDTNCPKCQGKLLSSDQKDETEKIIV